MVGMYVHNFSDESYDINVMLRLDIYLIGATIITQNVEKIIHLINKPLKNHMRFYL